MQQIIRKIALLGTSTGSNLAAEGITESMIRLGHPNGVSAVVTWSGPMDIRSSRLKTLRVHDTILIKNYISFCPDTNQAKYDLATLINHIDSTDPPMLVVNSIQEDVPLA